MIIKGVGIKCSKCNTFLSRAPHSTHTYLDNPKYTYYFMACGCDPKETRTIRIINEEVEYEIVTKEENDHRS